MTTVTWICHTCKDQPQFAHDDFVAHVKSVHGLTDGTRGRRQPISFMDGRDWYRNIFEWTINDLKFTQTVFGERAEDDPMRIA